MNCMGVSVVLGSEGSEEALRKAAQSENTRVAYEKGWRCFASWCSGVGVVPQDATSDDVVRFLIAMASGDRRKPLALNTLRLYRSGLNDRWRRMELPSPASANVVDEVLQAWRDSVASSRVG